MMGWETANIHLGSRNPNDLGTRFEILERAVGKSWLVEAAEGMAASTRADHSQWATQWQK
jgi:hypothetical protein